jgi:hypothetical protein
MSTKEIFVSGTVSNPFAVSVKQNCIVNNVRQYITIEKVEIPNHRTSKEDRDYSQKVIKELKQKHNLL